MSWKTTYGRHKGKIIVGIVIAIVIVYGYYNCWFGGPNHYINLNWCPWYCYGNETTDNQTDGGNQYTPPQCSDDLDGNLRDFNTIYYDSAKLACGANNGQVLEANYIAACSEKSPTDPLFVPVDCVTHLADTTVQSFIAECNRLGGTYHCQDNWVGCYCPGNIPVIPEPIECSLQFTYTNLDGLTSTCYGPCPDGTTCMDGGNILQGTPACGCYEQGGSN